MNNNDNVLIRVRASLHRRQLADKPSIPSFNRLVRWGERVKELQGQREQLLIDMEQEAEIREFLNI